MSTVSVGYIVVTFSAINLFTVLLLCVLLKRVRVIQLSPTVEPTVNRSDAALPLKGINLIQGCTSPVKEVQGEKEVLGHVSPEGVTDDISIEVVDEYVTQSYYKQGLLAFYQHKYEEAIRHLSAAITMDPEFAYAYEYRGEAYIWSGEKEKGQEDIRRAQELRQKH